MLIKKIAYEDFFGNKREDEFYFNYSKADVNRLMFSTKEGLGDFLKRITKEEDRHKMFAFLEEFILGSVGEPSPDGRQFIKNEELSNAFKQSNAYSVLLDEFIDGGDEAIADFINAVTPKDFAKEVQKAQKAQEQANDNVTQLPVAPQA